MTSGAPLGRGAGVVVLAHGRNAGPRNILDLATAIDRADVTWLAPAAADRTWYPSSFMAPRAQNEPWLTSALGALAAVIASATAQGVPSARIVLAGFSQGACLATEFVFRHPGQCGGLIALSGGLVGAAGTTWPDPPSHAGLPAFFGCSDIDAHVPWARVAESAAVFAQAAADVDLRRYPGMGHLVNDDEIVAARQLLDRVLGAR